MKAAAEGFRDSSDKAHKAGDQVSSSIDVVDVEPQAQTADRAIVKMNKAAALLHHIIAVLSKKSNPGQQLPKLESLKSLDEGVLQMNEIINKLIRKHNLAKDSARTEKGVLSNFANALENIGRHVTPFLKVFLAVSAQCSAVKNDYFTPLTR